VCVCVRACVSRQSEIDITFFKNLHFYFTALLAEYFAFKNNQHRAFFDFVGFLKCVSTI